MRQKDVIVVVDTLSETVAHATAEELPGLLVATGELRNAIRWLDKSGGLDIEGFNRVVSQVTTRYQELRGATPQDALPPQDNRVPEARGWGR